MPKDFQTLPVKKDIQQSAAKSAECWSDCYLETAGVMPLSNFSVAGSAGQGWLSRPISASAVY